MTAVAARKGPVGPVSLIALAMLTATTIILGVLQAVPVGVTVLGFGAACTWALVVAARSGPDR